MEILCEAKRIGTSLLESEPFGMPDFEDKRCGGTILSVPRFTRDAPKHRADHGVQITSTCAGCVSQWTACAGKSLKKIIQVCNWSSTPEDRRRESLTKPQMEMPFEQGMLFLEERERPSWLQQQLLLAYHFRSSNGQSGLTIPIRSR